MIIETGDPEFDGFYVVYMSYQAQPGKPFPMVLAWRKGGWRFCSNENHKFDLPTHGWIGPLPAVKVAAPVEYDL